MPIERSFSEILEALYEETVTTDLEFHSETTYEASLEPAWMAQLLAQMGDLKVIKAQRPLSHFYKRTIPATPPKAHVLSEEQQSACLTLNSFTQTVLSPYFTLRELKSTYRQALLKTHPDQGGNAESFQMAKKSYEILRSLVTK